MSAAAIRTKGNAATWRQEFLTRAFPIVRRYAEAHFRGWRSQEREEAIADAIAIAFVDYIRLCEQGRNPADFPSRIADFAIRQVRSCRRVGQRQNCRDVMSRLAQRQRRFRVTCFSQGGHSKHHRNGTRPGWQDLVVEGRRSTPAEIAACRIDFAAWLRQLKPRNRRIAQELAGGESVSRIAQRFKLSLPRISQLRREFEESWRTFHGEAESEQHSSEAVTA